MTTKKIKEKKESEKEYYIPKQIIPAPHCFAVLETSDGRVRLPLVCWAMNDDGVMTGMIADTEGDILPVFLMDGFQNYDLEYDEYVVESVDLN